MKRRIAHQCISKPAPWVVAKRIRERKLGYRAFQVLAFIRKRVESGLPPPSYREICDVFGMDQGNLHRLVVSLERRGIIYRADRTHWCEPIIRLVA